MRFRKVDNVDFQMAAFEDWTLSDSVANTTSLIVQTINTSYDEDYPVDIIEEVWQDMKVPGQGIDVPVLSYNQLEVVIDEAIRLSGGELPFTEQEEDDVFEIVSDFLVENIGRYPNDVPVRALKFHLDKIREGLVD